MRRYRLNQIGNKKECKSVSSLFDMPEMCFATKRRLPPFVVWDNMYKHKLKRGTPSRELAICLAKPKLCGEIFKEPSLDVLVTDLEQTAFSLTHPTHYNALDPQASQKKDRNRKNIKSDSSISNSSSISSGEENSPKFEKQKIATPHDTLPPRSTLTTFFDLEKSSSYNLTGAEWVEKGLHLHVRVGDYVHCGDTVGERWGRPLVLGTSGRITRISESQLVVQRTQPVLYYSQAHVHVQDGQWVERNTPILTLTHQTLVTGDIVQGIPRIEQLFEASHSPPAGIKDRDHLHETLHSQVREIFRQNWSKMALPVAVRQSLQQIQQILVESIQKVYLLQGVLIADKHIEIVVRQMTCKAQVLDGGDTGLLLEELLNVQQIENANLTTPGKKALYAPVVVGLTRSALESDSFLSAASFQESTRVLSRDALIGKSDFARGLKEKVVIGDLISAGTGLDVYFVYTLLSPGAPGSDVQIESNPHLAVS